MGSLINHPTHYNLPGKKECIEQMLEDYGGRITAVFCLTNAYKYLYRAGEKEGSSKEEDLNKAKWYFDFVNKRLNVHVRYTNAVKLYTYVKTALKENGIDV